MGIRNQDFQIILKIHFFVIMHKITHKPSSHRPPFLEPEAKTYIDLLDLGWVSGSCQRIQDDSSPHHSVQHECLQLAKGFNFCIYQQVVYKCSSRAPSASVPMDRLPENHLGQWKLQMAYSMPCKSQAFLPYFKDVSCRSSQSSALETLSLYLFTYNAILSILVKPI